VHGAVLLAFVFDQRITTFILSVVKAALFFIRNFSAVFKAFRFFCGLILSNLITTFFFYRAIDSQILACFDFIV